MLLFLLIKPTIERSDPLFVHVISVENVSISIYDVSIQWLTPYRHDIYPKRPDAGHRRFGDTLETPRKFPPWTFPAKCDHCHQRCELLDELRDMTMDDYLEQSSSTRVDSPPGSSFACWRSRDLQVCKLQRYDSYYSKSRMCLMMMIETETDRVWVVVIRIWWVSWVDQLSRA